MEELASLEPKWSTMIGRWLAGTVEDTDAEAMVEIVEKFVDDGMIVWPEAVTIRVEDGAITLTANILPIKANA